MITEAIKAHLVNSTVTSVFLAGLGGAPDRVYPLIMPQKKPRGAAVVPAVVIALSSVERQKLYCGTSGKILSRLILDCYATSYDEAKVLADAVRQALQDYSGNLGGIIAVADASLESEIDLQDIDPGLYRVSQSWAIWHTE